VTGNNQLNFCDLNHAEDIGTLKGIFIKCSIGAIVQILLI